MQKSEAYQRARGVAPLLACCVLGAACAEKQAPPQPPSHRDFQVDFNVAPASGGQAVIWWLRITGPQFTAMVHRAARQPQLGRLDTIVHKNIDMLIQAGLLQHGIIWCDTSRRTLAELKGGTLQWTGCCVPYVPEGPVSASDLSPAQAEAD